MNLIEPDETAVEMNNEANGPSFSEAIFERIATNRRVNYYDLVDVYQAVFGDGHDRDEVRTEIRNTIDILKQKKWVGELTLPNDELSVFYLTAEGSLAADDDY
jgi:hypothetical protein